MAGRQTGRQAGKTELDDGKDRRRVLKAPENSRDRRRLEEEQVEEEEEKEPTYGCSPNLKRLTAQCV